MPAPDRKGHSLFQEQIPLPLPLLWLPALQTFSPGSLRHTLPFFSWRALGVLKVTANTCNLCPPGHSERGNPDGKPERKYLPTEKYIYTVLHSEL